MKTLNNFHDLEKFFVGYTDFPSVSTNAHPRFNIFKLAEGGYEIQLAVPGLSKEQIQITHHKDTLFIKGEKVSLENKGSTIHRGFSGKGFERSFKIDADLEVGNADLNNGVLTITLQHSEATKPIRINIA